MCAVYTKYTNTHSTVVRHSLLSACATNKAFTDSLATTTTTTDYDDASVCASAFLPVYMCVLYSAEFRLMDMSNDNAHEKNHFLIASTHY